MVGKVYDPPGINRTPRANARAASKPSPATTLCATPVKDPEPVVVPRFKSRPDVGLSPAPAPTHLASGQAVASIVNPTSSTALNPALASSQTGFQNRWQIQWPNRRPATLRSPTEPAKAFLPMARIAKLPVQQAIFRFALEQSRRIDDTAGYMKMSEVLGLVSKATRKIVQPSVELYHALDNDDLSRLLRLQKKALSSTQNRRSCERM